MTIDNLRIVADALASAECYRQQGRTNQAYYEKLAKEKEDFAASLLREARLEAQEFMDATRLGLGSGKTHGSK